MNASRSATYGLAVVGMLVMGGVSSCRSASSDGASPPPAPSAVSGYAAKEHRGGTKIEELPTAVPESDVSLDSLPAESPRPSGRDRVSSGAPQVGVKQGVGSARRAPTAAASPTAVAES